MSVCAEERVDAQSSAERVVKKMREKRKAQCRRKVKGRSRLPPAKKLGVSPVMLVFEMKLGAGACG